MDKPCMICRLSIYPGEHYLVFEQDKGLDGLPKSSPAHMVCLAKVMGCAEEDVMDRIIKK